METAVGGADACSMGERCLSLRRRPLSLAFLLGDAPLFVTDEGKVVAACDVADVVAADDEDDDARVESAQLEQNHSSVVGTLLRPMQNV